MDVASIITVFTSVSALIISVISIRKAFWEGKKEEVSVASSYEEMAEKATSKLKTERANNEELHVKIRNMEETQCLIAELLVEYENGIDLLIRQLELNRITPAWKPTKKFSDIKGIQSTR